MGFISPNDFIPLLESNNYIYSVDCFIWEETCKYLRNCMEKSGDKVLPLSVNVSRMDLYNDGFIDTLENLVSEYRIPHSLLKLEITESAYMDGAQILIDTVSRLHEKGFIIEMDDFGSGFSSLNTLKDVPVDVLKLDMRFLRNSEENEMRGSAIISSILRMSRWLDLPVIAEGVETQSQLSFLASLGCNYAQGYYFAKPMPLSEYDSYSATHVKYHKKEQTAVFDYLTLKEFWNTSGQNSVIFNKYSGAAVIVEAFGDAYEAIRYNDRFFQEIGINISGFNIDLSKDILKIFDEPSRINFVNAINKAKTGDAEECELTVINGGKKLYLRANIKLLAQSGESLMFFVSVVNVTESINSIAKAREELKHHELYKMLLESTRMTIFEYDTENETLDYSKINAKGERENHIINNTFLKWADEVDLIYADDKEKFHELFLEACDKETKGVYEFRAAFVKNEYRWQRAHYKSIADVNGKIFKVVGRLYDVQKEKDEQATLQRQSKTDSLTGLRNRLAVEDEVDRILSQKNDSKFAFVVMDVDRFKAVNDTYGHPFGDEVLKTVARVIKESFRENDIIGRIGGDEFFIMFDADGKNVCETIEGRMNLLLNRLLNVTFENGYGISASIGVSVYPDDGDKRIELYTLADKALYAAKSSGRSRYVIYNR